MLRVTTTHIRLTIYFASSAEIRSLPLSFHTGTNLYTVYVSQIPKGTKNLSMVELLGSEMFDDIFCYYYNKKIKNNNNNNYDNVYGAVIMT